MNCQGLHDVLAIIVWVVHCDHQSWQNADDSAQSLGFVEAERLLSASLSLVNSTRCEWFTSVMMFLYMPA